MKKLALFIHGLLSDASTWNPLLAFLRDDIHFSAIYDVDTFEYETRLITGESAPRIAEALATFISTRHGDRDEIAIVGHSQGGS